VVLSACGGTERSRRTFPVEVVAATSGIVTDSGWSVSLTKASLRFEAVRFFEGKAVISRAAPWWKQALISEAWAHPGHYVPGEAVGEWVGALDVDLLKTDTLEWGTASAITGDIGSAQLTLGALVLEGVATKDGASVEFSVTSMPELPLEGIPFEHVLTTAAGSVQLEVRLPVLLSRVDFSRVGASAKPLDMTSPAYNGVVRGLVDTSAYGFTWKEQ
jgi:hypothetical protein